MIDPKYLKSKNRMVKKWPKMDSSVIHNIFINPYPHLLSQQVKRFSVNYYHLNYPNRIKILGEASPYGVVRSQRFQI